jgi:16S rRNA (cytidine1402-2'-O)-methyltransferase
LPLHAFCFIGFLPRTSGQRTRVFAHHAESDSTLVAFESPHRLLAALHDLVGALGADRPVAVARELTKRFEEVRRGTLAELAAHYAANTARGEIAIVVGPAPEERGTAEELEARLRDALAAGMSVRDAAAAVAEATGLPRKQVYARALEMARG